MVFKDLIEVFEIRNTAALSKLKQKSENSGKTKWSYLQNWTCYWDKNIDLKLLLDKTKITLMKSLVYAHTGWTIKTTIVQI